jgi:hypothetical protein
LEGWAEITEKQNNTKKDRASAADSLPSFFYLSPSQVNSYTYSPCFDPQEHSLAKFPSCSLFFLFCQISLLFSISLLHSVSPLFFSPSCSLAPSTPSPSNCACLEMPSRHSLPYLRAQPSDQQLFRVLKYGHCRRRRGL